MTGFLFALMAVLFAGLGARDQITMADVSARSGQKWPILAVAVAVSLMTAAGAGWAATAIIPMLTVKARLIFAAFAFAFAGAESLFVQPGRKPREPTQSLGAFSIVLTAQQVTDAARFLILALAVLTSAPIMAAAGGAAGAILSMGLAWSAPELFERQRMRILRKLIGGALLLVAIVLVFT